MKKSVVLCNSCFDAKKFGEFVLSPAKLLIEIADDDVRKPDEKLLDLRFEECPKCEKKRGDKNASIPLS